MFELLYQLHFTLSGWAYILNTSHEPVKVIASWICYILMSLIEIIT